MVYGSDRSKLIMNGFVAPNAKGLQSYHQYGFAIDIWSVRDGEIVAYNKKISANERDKISINDAQKLGPIGESLGLEWGGRWSNKDWPHFQLLHGKAWVKLKPQLLKIGIENYKNLII